MTQSQSIVFDVIWQEVRRRLSQDAPFVVGITGIDTAGKSRFAQGLGAFLAAQAIAVETIHLDDFHHPRAIRRSDTDEIENYYNSTFDLERLQALLLRPIREQRRVSVTYVALNLETDRYTETRRYRVEPGTIVLLEGVFLMRPELAPFVGYMIYLDIAPQVAIERAEVRDRPRFGAEIMERYRSKYLPAQARYLAMFRPEDYANMVIDNSDWHDPKITLMRQDRSGVSGDPDEAATEAQA